MKYLLVVSNITPKEALSWYGIISFRVGDAITARVTLDKLTR
jgi:hypothetical protein